MTAPLSTISLSAAVRETHLLENEINLLHCLHTEPITVGNAGWWNHAGHLMHLKQIRRKGLYALS